MKKIVAFVVAFALIALGGFGFLSYQYIHSPYSNEKTEVLVEVAPGPFYKTAIHLRNLGLIADTKFLVWYTQIRGDVKNIKVGEYKLSKSSSPKEIIDLLISGDTVRYNVTIPEGYNIFEIAKVVAAAGLYSESEFLDYVRKPENVLKVTGFKAPSFEGFLFPDTYSFSRQDSLQTVVKTMYSHFDKVYKAILATPNQKTMSRLEHVTMASIIEKETGAAFERPMISSVFHNRLQKKMRIQSDPTILYGIMIEEGRWLNNIRRKHIRQKTAYNTYTIPALPPAPIANPGKAALEAALNPAKSSYLYFVSQNDGTHVFTKTYKDHLKAVQKYQLDRKARQGKSWRDLNKNKK